jgi:predicted DCC family thiol-disulfide oxidoreductase YuxK
MTDVATARFEVFFDGECPLCVREIRMLGRLDRRHRIRFTDIAAPSFDPSELGVPLEQLMARIHGRDLRGDAGELIEGVEVFRRLYAAVGLGPLVRITRAPVVRHALDRGYDWFAKHRLWLTGRSDETADAGCTDGRCAVPQPAASKAR